MRQLSITNITNVELVLNSKNLQRSKSLAGAVFKNTNLNKNTEIVLKIQLVNR